MAYQIPKKPNLVRNSIAFQAKQAANSLTVQEWNHVVNVLKQQANLNTEYLENLHRVLFTDWDSNTSGFVDFPSDNIFGYVIRIIEELRNTTTVYIGAEVPADGDNDVLWIDTGEEFESIYIGISGGVFTSSSAELLTGGTFLSVYDDILYGGVF